MNSIDDGEERGRPVRLRTGDEKEARPSSFEEQ